MERIRARFEAGRVETEEQPSSAPDLTRALEARIVGFGYGRADGAAALTDVSFTLRAGKVTAVIGPSGAGKSTLADLLLGLLAPDVGMLLVDGQEIDGPRRRAWRSRVAFVPQEIVLAQDTIL